MRIEVLDDNLEMIGYNKDFRIVHVFPKAVCDYYVIQEWTNTFWGWKWKTIEGEKEQYLTSLRMATDWLYKHNDGGDQIYKVIDHYEN